MCVYINIKYTQYIVKLANLVEGGLKTPFSQ